MADLLEILASEQSFNLLINNDASDIILNDVGQSFLKKEAAKNLLTNSHVTELLCNANVAGVLQDKNAGQFLIDPKGSAAIKKAYFTDLVTNDTFLQDNVFKTIYRLLETFASKPKSIYTMRNIANNNYEIKVNDKTEERINQESKSILDTEWHKG